jgi:cation diffusion facilitator family transporter
MAGESSEQGSRRSVVAALISNSCVAVIKFAAAALSGSASMLAESFHSVADTGNEGLLLVGMRKAREPPDPRHPFGRGQERFFWSFVVAVSLFTVGAAVSIFQGVSELIHGHEVSDPGVALAHTLEYLASGQVAISLLHDQADRLPLCCLTKRRFHRVTAPLHQHAAR